MNKNLKLILIISIVVLTIFVVALNGGTIDAASVKGQTKCVGANAALKFIQTKGCVRTYNDQNCAEKGLVEISC